MDPPKNRQKFRIKTKNKSKELLKKQQELREVRNDINTL